MGYDFNRFTGEIDDEFQCSICSMVLEDPVQTTCEHSFCGNCIKDWLSTNQTCPVDRMPLTISDLKPASRPFRNLWNKLDIKCDFELQGCLASTKLENLALHVSSCEYNLSSDIVCDKGCNMTITRREYNINNCFSHLANRLQDENRHDIRKLTDEVRGLRDEVSGLHEEMKRLNDDVSRQRSQLEQFEAAMKTQQIAELTVSLKPLTIEECINVNIDPTYILKVHDPYREGKVLLEPLEPGQSNFKVRVLSIEDWCKSRIGLTKKSIDVPIYYTNYFGKSHTSGERVFPKWSSGDIIECGVTFPKNIVNNGDYSATAYISRNKEILFNKSLTIPKEGIYPFIDIEGKNTRLQYFQ